MEAKKAIILARVSTLEQEYEAQISDIEKFAKGLGYSQFKVVKNKESGFKSFDKREGFNKVIEIIESDEGYNTLICTELSRLSRNEVVLQQIKEYLIKNNIQLIVKDNNFFLLDEDGNVNANTNLVFSIFASLAASEMQKIKRFLRARKQYAAEGYSHGGKELFGYTRILDEVRKKSTYIVNEEEKEQIIDVFRKYVSETISIRDLTLYCISKGYSTYLHSKRNVTKMLSEQAYTGYKETHNKRKNADYFNYGILDAPKYIECDTREMRYPQIISKALFIQVQQKKLANRVNADKSTKNITLLAKLIKCVNCGSYFTGNYRVRGNIIAHTYRCSKRHTINDCSNKASYSMTLLDSVIWAFVKDNVTMLVSKLNHENSEQTQKEIKEAIENLNNKKREVLEKRNTAKRVLEIDLRIDTKKALADYEKKVSEIQKEIEQIDKLIEKYELELEHIKAKKKLNAELDIKNRISEIENSKEFLSYYIHQLISEIRVISNNSSYLVCEVDTLEDLGFRLSMSAKELRNILSNSVKEGERVEGKLSYYIVISKSNGRLIKVRYFLKNCAEYVDGLFYKVTDSFRSSAISLDDIFNYDLQHRDIIEANLDSKTSSELKLHTLLFDVENLPFERLQVY